MDVLLRTWRAIPWQRFVPILRSRPAEMLLAGLLLGVFAAGGLTQFQSHWGSSGPMERGLCAAMLLGCAAGYALQRQGVTSWPAWLMLSAICALLLPSWQDQIANVISRLSSSPDLSPANIELIGLAIGLFSTGIPFACWTGVICSVCPRRHPGDSPSVESSPIGLLGAGCAGGVFLTALLFGPALGIEITAIVGAALAMAVSYRGWHRDGRGADRTVRDVIPLEISAGQLATIGLALFGCGGAITLSLNLTSQLMPVTVYIQQFGWSVIIAGVVLGCLISNRWRTIPNQTAWALLLIIAGLSWNGFAFSLGIRFSLWSAAFLVSTTVHQLALAGLLLVAVLPLAMAAGLLIGRPHSTAIIGGSMLMLLGGICFRELALQYDVRSLTVALLCLCSGLAVLSFLITRGSILPRWQLAAAAMSLLCGGLSPWLQPTHDSALPAKLLFSTPTFLAYRAGWTTDLLPQLDDARLVAAAAGRHGPLTVWKSRGSDLMLREAGIPCCAISCRPDVSPQMPSEVLQTVLPLLISHESRTVLLLGSSGGIPLSTCLSFPVQQVRCVEPDGQRIELIRGDIAAERGFDPFSDDRVAIDGRSVELAAVMSDGDYDVILSSPPLSAVVAAAPQFTTEFYQHVSNKLSADGVFCQRFEAVDYGRLPFQLVVRSLQTAFQNVVAVEIGVGEYLFLATNSERGLTPAALPDRLETPHVRRVLSRCGWDWSTLLTLAAWDHAALKEIADDDASQANTAANCRLAFTGPRDMLRWSPKLKEVQDLLTKPCSQPVQTASTTEGPPTATSRRARYLDWLGEQAASKDLLRRLSEVAAQTKIILEGPDSFWLDYRKALRDQLQQRPRTEIRQVAATEEAERVLHREDERRKDYFQALGEAGDVQSRSLEAVFQLTEFFEPYDPLVSLFARQETAELLSLYGHPDPAAELALRLHVIRFAPPGDRSLRNVLTAAELVLRSPEAAADPQDRFDILNDLLETFRRRWEFRSNSQVKSVKLAIQDVDRSVVTIEKIVKAMNELASSTAISAEEWRVRQEVIDRVLLRPLRGYRSDLVPQYQENKMKAEAVRRESKSQHPDR